MKIDWSKAPEGTEACYPGDKQMYPAWYRTDRYGCVEQICEASGTTKWTTMGGRRDFPYGSVLHPKP